MPDNHFLQLLPILGEYLRMDNDSKGDIGETELLTWCTRASIDCSAPRKDKNGWDYYVQIQNQNKKKLGPLEQQPPKVSCKFQVKTCSPRTRRIAISLSNWQTMVSELVPWFVMVFVVKKEEVAKSYLIHIDQSYAERVLTRLRKLSPAQAKRIHKMTMDLTWDKSNEIPLRDKSELRRVLLDHVGDTHEYTKTKMEYFSKGGYSDRPIEVSFSVTQKTQDSTFEAMADFAVGITRDLSLSSMSVVETRFDVPRTIEKTSKRGTKMSLGKRPFRSPVFFTMTDIERTRRAVLRCKMYSSSWVFPFLPKKFNKYLFVSRFVTFIVSRKNGNRILTTRLHFHPKQPIRVSEIANIGKLMLMLSNSHEQGTRIEFRFAREDVPSVISETNSRFVLPPGAARSATVFEQLGELADSFDLDKFAKTDVDEVLSQGGAISIMARVLKQGSLGGSPTRVVIDKVKSDSITGKSCALVVPVGVTLCGQFMVVLLALIGTATLNPRKAKATKDSVSLKANHVRILMKKMVPTSERTTINIKSASMNAEKNLRAEGIDIVLSPASRSSKRRRLGAH